MKVLKTLALVLLLAAAFAGGYVARASKHGATGPNQRTVLYYVDPMHPAYKSDKPGVAPDCGMTLEPVYADDVGTAAGTTGSQVHEEGLAPPGAIRVSPERQQTIGVKFATVEWDSFARSIRTVGKVTYDETRVAHVHARVDGWIEQVFVDFTGDFVKKDDPMLTIYSPEMLASQRELLLAARARDLMPSLFDTSRRRLELWNLSADQIQQVVNTGEPIRNISLRAPMSGFVLERKAFPNQKVTPDSDLYTIADLSRVWIMADVFESDVMAVNIGQAASLIFPYPGTRSTAAKVNYIQPQVDPVTRTVKVRLNAANPGFRLKPEMFVNVEFGIAASKRLTIPAGALLDTGNRQTVFVDLGDGYLEPRQVEVAERLGDRIAVNKGLSVGERVVSSGTFLIDSESQLKAAAGGMGKPEHRHD